MAHVGNNNQHFRSSNRLADEKQAIIVDIDNTILNNDRRKLEILNHRFHKQVTLDDVRKDFNLANVLVGDKEKEEFWRIFFSAEFLRFDEPVRFAAGVLSDLAKEYDIVYLTGRHDDKASGDSMRDATLDCLTKYGFPLKENAVYFKDKRDTPDASFKTSKIQSLTNERNVAFAVGDHPDDIRLYASFKVFPIAIRTVYFKDSKFADASIAPLILDDWAEVEDFVRFMGPGNPDMFVQQLADEYKGYPAALDSITSFLLLVDTFALGFVLNAFAGQVGSLDLLTRSILFASISLLLLSITFGIFALLPRSFTYPHVGEPVMSIHRLRKEEPQSKANEAMELSADDTKKAWLRLVADSYRTLDPKVAIVERIMNLRSVTYEKIKWIDLSVVALLAGMGLLIPLTFVGAFWIQVAIMPITVSIGLFLYLKTRFPKKRSPIS